MAGRVFILWEDKTPKKSSYLGLHNLCHPEWGYDDMVIYGMMMTWWQYNVMMAFRWWWCDAHIYDDRVFAISLIDFCNRMRNENSFQPTLAQSQIFAIQFLCPVWMIFMPLEIYWSLFDSHFIGWLLVSYQKAGYVVLLTFGVEAPELLVFWLN